MPPNSKKRENTSNPGSSKKPPKEEGKKTQVDEEVDSSPDSEPEVDESLQKYIGEEDKVLWFRNIIRVQAKHVMDETIMEEMKKATKQLEAELQEMLANVTNEHKKYMKEARETMEALQSENKKKQRRIEKMEFLIQKKDEKINELLIKVDSLEQKEYVRDVQIVGLPETKSEKDGLKSILKLSKEKLGIKLKTGDVNSIHCLSKKIQNRNRDMIVSFRDISVRDAIYHFTMNVDLYDIHFLELRPLLIYFFGEPDSCDILLVYHQSVVIFLIYQKRKSLSANMDPSKNMYVNDRLTNYRKGLFFATRKLYKAKKLFATWTQKGNVLVRKSEESMVVQIQSYRDLDEFMRTSPTASEDDSRLSSGTCADILSHLSDYYFEDDDDDC